MYVRAYTVMNFYNMYNVQFLVSLLSVIGGRNSVISDLVSSDLEDDGILIKPSIRSTYC